jgi:hypothetical protein
MNTKIALVLIIARKTNGDINHDSQAIGETNEKGHRGR